MGFKTWFDGSETCSICGKTMYKDVQASKYDPDTGEVLEEEVTIYCPDITTSPTHDVYHYHRPAR